MKDNGTPKEVSEDKSNKGSPSERHNVIQQAIQDKKEKRKRQETDDIQRSPKHIGHSYQELPLLLKQLSQEIYILEVARDTAIKVNKGNETILIPYPEQLADTLKQDESILYLKQLADKVKETEQKIQHIITERDHPYQQELQILTAQLLREREVVKYAEAAPLADNPNANSQDLKGLQAQAHHTERLLHHLIGEGDHPYQQELQILTVQLVREQQTIKEAFAAFTDPHIQKGTLQDLKGLRAQAKHTEQRLQHLSGEGDHPYQQELQILTVQLVREQQTIKEAFAAFTDPHIQKGTLQDLKGLRAQAKHTERMLQHLSGEGDYPHKQEMQALTAQLVREQQTVKEAFAAFTDPHIQKGTSQDLEGLQAQAKNTERMLQHLSGEGDHSYQQERQILTAQLVREQQTIKEVFAAFADLHIQEGTSQDLKGLQAQAKNTEQRLQHLARTKTDVSPLNTQNGENMSNSPQPDESDVDYYLNLHSESQ